MRNLKECQAEVFRRSAKRIKERKQRRKQILMTCIPVVLCTTLACSFVLSQRKPVLPDAIAPSTMVAMGAQTEDRPESVTLTIARIEVSGVDFSKTYTQTHEIQAISQQLLACSMTGPELSFPTGESEQNETTRGESDASIADVLENSATDEYTIILDIHGEDHTEYCLSGNTLENRTTNQIYLLSREQVEELKELLGIPKP